MVNQAEIYRMVQSEDAEERRKAVNEIRNNFSMFSDKKQGWDDLIHLISDKNIDVRWTAAQSLGDVFLHTHDKKLAWTDLHLLTMDKDSIVRWRVASAIGVAFPFIPDKEQAWADLHRLIEDKDRGVRRGTIDAIGLCFSYIPNKEEAWEALHRQTQDMDDGIRQGVIDAIGLCFSNIPNKEKAWSDLHRLTNDKDKTVRGSAAYSLGAAFSYIPDKKQAWEDLHRLTHDKDIDVRWSAAYSLGAAFSYIPDKKQAWDDLHELTQELDGGVRVGAAGALGAAFSYIPNKKQAWIDLIQLSHDKNSDVQWRAAYSLGAAFPYIPDKKQAWDDLHHLMLFKEGNVLWGVAYSLGAAFPYIPDKKQAWDDLHRLTQDENGNVRRGASHGLGIAFSHIPDKNWAWKDLIRLAQDEDSDVRVAANHSLGRVSIYRASQAKSDESVREELETALRYFEKSSNEASYFNPAKFCLPFYRSFYTITFRKEDAEAEVNKYLAKAKNAVEGSESKEKLLEAVENLGNALKEVQKTRDLNGVKCDLNAYRLYCERAADMLDEAEDKAPGAARLVRKGLPIIDERIKEILGEVEEKTRVLYKQSKGTIFEENAIEANKIGSILLPIRDPIGLDKNISNLQFIISDICEKFPENDKGEACKLIKKLNNEPEIEDKINWINMVLSKISSQIEIIDRQTTEIINQSNANVLIGDKNKQEINTPLNHNKDSRIKPEKPNIFKIITDTSILAALAGFFAVEIGTYFYPVSYNHLIGVFIAVVILIIGIFIKHQRTKKV